MHMRKFFLTLSALFFLLINTQAQNRTVTGKVTDENGQGIQGVSVLVKGTGIGTETNADGNFSLSVPVNARTLVISSVNMATQETAITGGTDENGQGIQGVSVLVKGTGIGTETNADGNFSLSANPGTFY